MSPEHSRLFLFLDLDDVTKRHRHSTHLFMVYFKFILKWEKVKELVSEDEWRGCTASRNHIKKDHFEL